MNRNTPTRQSNSTAPLPARRAGTPVIAVVAFAAACVLAACGPDDATLGAAGATAASTTTTTTTTVAQYAPATPAQTATFQAVPAPVQTQQTQYTPAPRDYAPAATVAPARAVTVADRNNNAQPRAIYGQVSSIEPITQAPQTSGAGAVVGGVLGAVIGNQIGSGNGRAAATVLGGVGGAVVGNKVEKHRSENITGYRVHVQLDNGGSRSYERTNLNGLDVGDRVRVDGGRLREV